jgi:hypothetical protein
MRNKFNIVALSIIMIVSLVVPMGCTCAGGKVYNNAVWWDELRTPVNALRVNAAKPPSWVVFRNSEVLSFAQVANEVQENEVSFALQLPHGYKQGTDIIIHFHYTIDVEDRTKQAYFGLDYSWANIGDVFPAYQTEHVYTEMNAIADKHMYAAFPAISGVGKKISSMLVCRFWRDSAVHQLDTAKYNVLVFEIDAHYQSDTQGSINQLDK